MRVWLWASLICNMLIIVTGGVVRITGSGLGCSEWPTCEEGQLVPHGELGIHAAIEFGNRTLTGLLLIAAIGALVSVAKVRGRNSRLWWITFSVLLGIAAQAVLGGITVWVKLHPAIVAAHLVLSIALVVLCTWAVFIGENQSPDPVAPLPYFVVLATFLASLVAISTGTLTTGAGPHSGDAESVRNGLNIVSIARVHALSAWVVAALAVLTFVLLRKASRSAARVALIFLGVVVAQGAIGYIQYALGIPASVVWLHMVGLTVLTAVAAWLLCSVRRTSI
ncbi:heme A synthase [Tessaracoccus sp. OH4464_COT-324]|uniref:COX15/CtaA family protein n=1 Tax=Tessaracoccus sp. OH4464_COT-324 TaxID=2491059 RepID=UPI000F640E32|nr:COX15/CtaA family protein [Tessaracoccus sp. OH4464_COT-324]RRD47713.1 heme A synthase [Tessaracoccus sp. OH4464_COT-324]